MSETFIFDVNYGTPFADLDKLRAKMTAFVKSESSAFQRGFDIFVKGMSRMQLTILPRTLTFCFMIVDRFL